VLLWKTEIITTIRIITTITTTEITKTITIIKITIDSKNSPKRFARGFLLLFF